VSKSALKNENIGKPRGPLNVDELVIPALKQGGK